ncbi:MAG: hypothetical protein PGN13_12685 [Patulibacter minatonensis]
MPLLTTLFTPQTLRVHSDTTRAGHVTGYTWSAAKTPLTVAPKGVFAVPAFDPFGDVAVRPASLLARLGAATVPTTSASAFAIARWWSWVRYCWAFAAPTAGLPLRLSASADALGLHLRQRLSEDIGIATSIEVLTRHLRHGMPPATTINVADVDDVIAAGVFNGVPVAGTPGTKMRPDYLVSRQVPGSPVEVFALECKGTKSCPVGLDVLHKAAAQINGVTIGAPPGSAPPGYIGGVSARASAISMELFDPPGDELWSGEPSDRRTRHDRSPRAASLNLDGSIDVQDPAAIRRIVTDVAEAKLLALAGRPDAVAARLRAEQQGSSQPTERATDLVEVDGLGTFEGTELRLPLGGSGDVAVFIGLDRRLADALEADDETLIANRRLDWASRSRGRDTDLPDDLRDSGIVESDDRSASVALENGVLLRVQLLR